MWEEAKQAGENSTSGLHYVLSIILESLFNNWIVNEGELNFVQ